jgi:hypothetical protein
MESDRQPHRRIAHPRAHAARAGGRPAHRPPSQGGPQGGQILRLRTAIIARAIVALAIVHLTGCDRPPPANPPASPGGPRDTIARIIELRDQRRYASLEPLIHPDRAADTTRFVRSLDDFAAANTALCAWLRNHVAPGLAQTVDQAYIPADLDLFAGPTLGIFSTDVRLLDEAITGDDATVSYMIAGVLPARHATLRRIDDTWRLTPTDTPITELADAFDALTAGLQRARRALVAGDMAPDDILADPNILKRFVAAQLAPGVRLLPSPTTQPASPQQ